MITPLRSNNWLHGQNTLVQLIPKNEAAEHILKNVSHHWSIRPMPKPLREPQYEEVMRGWILLRSMRQQQRFVHVLHDRFFDVVFITKDPIPANEQMDNQHMKGKENVQ